jgi:transcriptional regulator with XRE-family HTH domain
VKHLSDKKALKLLGKRIRQLRKEQNISQSQLAYEAELALRQMGRIERGETNTTFLVLYKICKALDVSMPELHKFIEDSPD